MDPIPSEEPHKDIDLSVYKEAINFLRQSVNDKTEVEVSLSDDSEDVPNLSRY